MWPENKNIKMPQEVETKTSVYQGNQSKLTAVLKITPVPRTQSPSLALSVRPHPIQAFTNKFYKAYQGLTHCVLVMQKKHLLVHTGSFPHSSVSSVRPWIHHLPHQSCWVNTSLVVYTDILTVSGFETLFQLGLLPLDFTSLHSKCWVRNESLGKHQAAK